MSRTPTQTTARAAAKTEPIERNRTLLLISSLLLVAGELVALIEATQRLRKSIARRRQSRQLRTR